MSQPPPAVPQRTLQEVFGTLLIGTWISTAVLAFEATQVWRYFTLYPLRLRQISVLTPISTDYRRRDRAWIPTMILWMFALDVIAATAPHLAIYKVGVHSCPCIHRLRSSSGSLMAGAILPS